MLTEVSGSHPNGFKGSIPSGNPLTVLPSGHVGLGWTVGLIATCQGQVHSDPRCPAACH